MSDIDRLHRNVGTAIVATRESPLPLQSGGSLAPVTVAYETYGRLDGDNVVLVCHALTGSAHAAGPDEKGSTGWWDGQIGPGRAIDTDRWFVVCSNVLGSCYGSTGPGSREFDAVTRFPQISVRDMVTAQRRLLDTLGIERLHAVIGGSLGGMQALEWGATYGADVDRIVSIAAPAAHTPWAIGFGAIGREALELGRRAGDPAAGLRLARKVAMMTYRSGIEMHARFGRDRDADRTSGRFAVENYLLRHGEKLAARFDSATYEILSHAMDQHDLSAGRGDIDSVLSSFAPRALVVGISTDQLYPAAEQRELAGRMGAEYFQIDSPCGHDAFLIEDGQLGCALRSFLSDDEATARFTTTNGVRNACGCLEDIAR